MHWQGIIRWSQGWMRRWHSYGITLPFMSTYRWNQRIRWRVYIENNLLRLWSGQGALVIWYVAREKGQSPYLNILNKEFIFYFYFCALSRWCCPIHSIYLGNFVKDTILVVASMYCIGFAPVANTCCSFLWTCSLSYERQREFALTWKLLWMANYIF